LLPKLHAFFRELLINDEVNFWDGWFSFENVPLKWQFPVGLLFDIYSGNSDRLQDENGNGSKKDSSPVDSNGDSDIPRTWQLNLHFEDWPSEVLLKLDQEAKHLRDAFTNSYKEVS
jgi:autophagy-related protein 5